MPTTLASSTLEQSLAALGPGQAAVAEAVRTAPALADLDLAPAADGGLTGTLGGTRLASRHRPLEEGERLAARIDPREHAVAVVHGFGLGWHVAALCRRIRRTGVVIVVEPDVALLRAVLSAIDHADWMRESNLILVTDPEDRASLVACLDGAEWLLGQGVAFLDHPPSRARLGDAVRAFGGVLTDVVTRSKMTLVTTLLRSVETVRNLTGNLRHYTHGSGIAELAGVQAGRPAIVVSAGPSLGRTIDRLADPAVRERAVIIAVQTTLRPLLERGIRPHFVTALDYHQISTRFYEGLTAADVEGVELVVDPKAHPAILDAFPGRVRCCQSSILDAILGPAARPMGALPAGATVAHLSAYLARFLGCDPLILVGQDLAFTDGLYYSPGAAIHRTWAPELGPFNPVASMEWQRIARHRRYLVQLEREDGGQVYSDAQMLTYLQQFERDFARDAADGRRIVNATGGGARIAHTDPMSLDDALEAYADQPLAPWPGTSRPGGAGEGPDAPDAATTSRRVERAIRDRRTEIAAIREAARTSRSLIERMIEHQSDPARMASLFEALDRARGVVAERPEAFGILEHLNQLGAFKRIRADRRLTLSESLTPLERQRAELERDLVNVTWISDAADELLEQLTDAIDRVAGRPPKPRRRSRAAARALEDVTPAAHPNADATAPTTSRGAPVTPPAATAPASASAPVAAIVPIDAADLPRLAATLDDRSILEHTVARLRAARHLDRIVLVVESSAVDELPLSGDARAACTIEPWDGAPLGARGQAIDVARAFARGAWRGGIAGIGGADAALAPAAVAATCDRYDLGAALVCGADWPCLDPHWGVDALIERWREHPDVHRIVFSRVPPGCGGVLVRRDLADQLASGGRLATLGALLVHQPSAPQGDPIATDACVTAPPEACLGVSAMARDVPLDRLARAHDAGPTLTDVVAALVPRGAGGASAPASTPGPPAAPEHLVLDVLDAGDAAPRPWRGVGLAGPPRSCDVDRLLAHLEADGGVDGVAVTLSGSGDPIHHPAWRDLVRGLRDLGARAIHLRTRLDLDPEHVGDLLEAKVDVISVDLHAATAATYTAVMGRDRFGLVVEGIARLVEGRTSIDGPDGPAGLALPWIVPRLQRRHETVDELEAFHDRWQHALGTALVDAAPPSCGDTLIPAVPPREQREREAATRLVVLADGRCPIREGDPDGPCVAWYDQPWRTVWRAVLSARAADPTSIDSWRSP